MTPQGWRRLVRDLKEQLELHLGTDCVNDRKAECYRVVRRARRALGEIP